ncbi:hypothetical protein [uncultured Zoogloea sp.]|uniref:hypothetical protein n=1 Tax=uncultured Zoogloea sp. TaxID=160237 RepID=UPI0026164004|nr:hypothetical protein [uncultured Zoogloea sp.]
MSRKIPLALGTLALVAACAAPQVRLKPEARAEIDAVDSVLIVSPGTLGARASSPGARSTDPILETLHDYDLRAALQEAWRAESIRGSTVRFVPKLRVERISPGDPAGPAQMRTLFDNARGSAVMFANIDYRLRDSALVVSAQVEIYPRAPALLRFRHAPDGSEPLDGGSVIYRQRFEERQAPVTPASARGQLDDAVQGVVRQIIASLNEAP